MVNEELIERVKKKVKIDENGCWVWTGSTTGVKSEKKKTGFNYGRISVKGFKCLTHRVMYVCHKGYIPNKIQVDHICNNRLCCNPEHLEAVTNKINSKRRDKR